jgi:hypothetical protein
MAHAHRDHSDDQSHDHHSHDTGHAQGSSGHDHRHHGDPSTQGRAFGIAIVPGTTLVSLGSLSSAAVSTSTFTPYVFTPAAGFQQAAGTTYWIGLVAVDPVAVEWSWSSDLSPLGNGRSLIS